MKIKYILLILIFNCFTSFGQTIVIPEDSVKSLLCHKWNVNKITYGVQTVPESFEHIVYEFYDNMTFKRIIVDKVEEGKWVYDQSHGWIFLKANKLKLYVISLYEDEILLVANQPKTKDSIVIKSHLKRMDK